MSILKNKRTSFFMHKLLCFALLLFMSGLGGIHAQNRINSPYSMFGPGEVRGNEYFRNMSMGGLSQGFRSNLSVNYNNPASYTATDSLSFIFDAVVFSHFYQQSLNGEKQLTNYSTLGNFNFSFPVRRWWSVAAGILPYSQLGYKISEFTTNDVDGRINFLYEGSGGINQVYLGHGFRILPSLSVGFNASYLFGKSQDETIVSSDSLGFYSTIWNYTDEIDGFMFSYGIQWHKNFGSDRFINIGATYTHETLLDLKQNNTLIRELPRQTLPDTISHLTGTTANMKIPTKMGAGVFVKFNNLLGAGIDYETQTWSAFEASNQIQNLNDTYMVRLGAIYNPRIETYTSIFNRLEYRAGLRYGKSFLNLQNSNFNEFGISFGIGIPVRRSLSGLNIGFEYSTRMADNPGMIEENFFRVNLGLNVYERWFVKRRFF
jgi:hypothetical protein